jgi:1-acyl-sn-glycerol-3-phosphate acyltransferase
MGYFWAKGVLIALKLICNLSVNLEGEKNIPNKPFIIACKHQSTWETIFLTAYFREAKFILKKELGRIPFYGWYLVLSGMIRIDRKLGVRAIKKVISNTTLVLKKGGIVAIFPEGTRVKPSENVEYQPGVAAIHKANANIPILPIAVNSGYYWPKGISLIKRGAVTIRFLPPITSKNKKDELLKTLKETIDYHSNLLANKSIDPSS